MADSQKLSGINPLAYTGVEAVAPSQFTIARRNPTTRDYRNWEIGAEWLNQDNQTIWRLVKKNLSTFTATWILAFTAGAGDLNTLTGDTGGAVGPDGANNINLLTNFAPLTLTGTPASFTLTLSSDGTIPIQAAGDTGSAIPSGGVLNILGGDSITTSAVGNTITITADGDVPDTYSTDAGNAVPAAHVLQVLGGTNASTSGSGNTITITGSGALPLTYTTDSGSATPSGNVLQILGGLNIDTSGAGATVTIATPTLAEGVVYSNSSNVFTSLGKGDDGEILIGDSAGTPAWANITSTGGTITVTNGANSIDLQVAGAAAQAAFFAYLSSDKLNVSGDGTVYNFVCDSEVFDVGGDYDPTTGRFTAPSDGHYHLGCVIRMTGIGIWIPMTSNYTDPRIGVENITAGILQYINYIENPNCDPFQCGGITLIELSAGDVVRPFVQIFNTTLTLTSDVRANSNPYYTYFYGYRLPI